MRLIGRTGVVGTVGSWGWRVWPTRWVSGTGVARRRSLWLVWLGRVGHWRLRLGVGTCRLGIGLFGRWWRQTSYSNSTNAAHGKTDALRFTIHLSL